MSDLQPVDDEKEIWLFQTEMQAEIDELVDRAMIVLNQHVVDENAYHDGVEAVDRLRYLLETAVIQRDGEIEQRVAAEEQYEKLEEAIEDGDYGAHPLVDDLRERIEEDLRETMESDMESELIEWYDQSRYYEVMDELKEFLGMANDEVQELGYVISSAMPLLENPKVYAALFRKLAERIESKGKTDDASE